MDPVYLITGAAFLFLGTAILIQPRPGSGFALSRILGLLAAFSLLYGISEWLEMWQLTHGQVVALHELNHGLMLVAFVFLFDFGRRLVRLANAAAGLPHPWLHRLLRWPVYLLLGTLFVLHALVGDRAAMDFDVWGRYHLGLPGALLAGLGFLWYYRAEAPKLAPLGVKPYFTLAGVAFAAYAVLAGLVVPVSSCLPARWINLDSFQATFGVPAPLLRAVCAVLVAFAVVKTLRIFNLERDERLRQALAQSEAYAHRFQDLVESSSDWIWEVDTRPVYTYVSSKIRDVLGYTPEEVLGRSPFDLMTAAEAARLRTAYDALVTAHIPCYGMVNTSLHKDGHPVVLETNCVPVFGAAGELRGFRGIGRDITARQRAEAVLRRSERQLAEAQRIAKVGCWDWDIVHGDLYWSDEIYAIFGVAPGQFGNSYAAFLDAVHPDDRARVEQAVQAALDGVAPYNIEHRIVRSDGVRVVQEWGEVSFDTDGRPTRMVGTVQDITERRSAEQQLRQAASVFKNTTEGVIITGPDARIETVNEAFTRITGYTQDEVVGERPSLLQSGRHPREFYQAMWATLSATGHWQGEIWNRTKEGVAYPEWLTISAVRDENNVVINYIGVFSDISALKASQNKLEYAAHHDALTGLPNRSLLRDRLDQALARARRHDEGVALLFVDLDRFKLVNDTLGHEVGDLLLQEVARRLSACVREEDTVARMGGDEFVVVQQDIGEADAPAQLASRILAGMKQPMNLAGHDLVVGLSIGISLFPQDGEDISSLLKHADAAMYRAKELGRNGYQFFVGEMTAAGLERLELENDLRLALARDELFLQYQPQIDLRTGALTGAEALLRWRHPRHGLISPARFIALAEDIGMIGAIGDWVLSTACAAAREWVDAGLPPLRVAVNVSARQISQNHLLGKVEAALVASRLEPQQLEIEVTESVLMKDAEAAVYALSELKALGVALSIDDFGTGYSSLSYLKRFPLDKIKIDKSFVDGLPGNPDDAAIATAIIAMAHSLRRTVIAEGVETAAQRDFLLAQGCDEMQGYLFSRPLDAEAMLALLKSRQPDAEPQALPRAGLGG